MRLSVTCGLLVPLLAACTPGIVHQWPPGVSPENSNEFRNAAGERRYCFKPQAPSPGDQALALAFGGIGGLIGGIGGLIGAQRQPQEAAACERNARAQGFVPVGEVPPPTAEIEARRQAEQAARDERAAQSRRVRPDTN